ncbi:MAG: hypothetical protein WCK64_02310 [Synechococcaceae cyanobacterium ELA445]
MIAGNHPRLTALVRLLLSPLVGLGAGLTGLAPASAQERFSQDRFATALHHFEQRGFEVRLDHPRCASDGFFGLHIRGTAAVVVCPRGNRLETLLHEGWHGVQFLCLRDRPWIPRDEVERRLSRRDQRDIESLYAASKWQREAEARLMAALPWDRYAEELDRACGYGS